TTSSGTAGNSSTAAGSTSGPTGAGGNTSSSTIAGSGGAGGVGGGIGGTGGVGGRVGTGGMGFGGYSGYPACPARSDTIEGCLRSPDGALVKSPVSAAVTVVSSDQAPAGACSDLESPSSGPAVGTTWRVVVEASDSRRWTLYARMPSLPSDP